MKTTTILTLLFLVLFWGISGATIYQYEDDNGQVRYTNDVSSIPSDKLDQVIKIDETKSEQPASTPVYTGPIYPLNNLGPSAEERAKQREQAKRKAQLEAEYERLLAEKEALDNDKSFQKRRYKRKYQNRPYIQELVKREAWLIQRLADLERQLNSF